MEPKPVASTSSSGRTSIVPAMGARMPEATAMATVDEPIETRTVAASAHASSRGGNCAPMAKLTAACAAPEARRTPLKPPAAARITSGLAMGAKASIVSRRRPPELRYAGSCTLRPSVARATSAATTIATSGKPTRCRRRLGRVPLAATASAQPPARINATGNRIASRARRAPAGAGAVRPSSCGGGVPALPPLAVSTAAGAPKTAS